MERKNLCAYASVFFPVQHLAPEAVSGVMRPAMRQVFNERMLVSLSVFSTGKCVVFTGMTMDMVPVLQALAEADAESATRK